MLHKVWNNRKTKLLNKQALSKLKQADVESIMYSELNWFRESDAIKILKKLGHIIRTAVNKGLLIISFRIWYFLLKMTFSRFKKVKIILCWMCFVPFVEWSRYWSRNKLRREAVYLFRLALAYNNNYCKHYIITAKFKYMKWQACLVCRACSNMLRDPGAFHWYFLKVCPPVNKSGSNFDWKL